MRGSRLRFWIASFSILFLLASFGTREALHGIPILGWTAHGRLRFVLAFIVSVAAAHGLNCLLTETIARRVKVVATILACMLAGAIALIAIPNLALYAHYGTGPQVLGSALAALVSLAAVMVVASKPGSRVRLAIPLLVAVDLFSVLGSFNPPMSRKYFYPETPAISALVPTPPATRVLGIWSAMFPNSGAMFGVEQVSAHDPIAFEPYLRLLDRAGYDRGGYFYAFRRLPPRALLDFLGARHVIAPAGFPAPGLVLIHEGTDAWVFRNPSALPRFFVPARVATSRNPGEDLLQSSDGRVAFVSGPSHPVSAARMRVVEYGASSARLEIESAGESFIASSELALPGWSLELDGEAWPIEVINGTFLGWTVPAGRHTASLVYRPERSCPSHSSPCRLRRRCF